MCVRTRIIYTCGHYGWGDKDLLECNVQKAYKQGIWSVECDTMTSHPLKTFKVTQLCTVCVKKKSRTDGVVNETKTKIAELSAVLKRLKEKKTQWAQDELEENEQRERDRFARLELGRFRGVDMKSEVKDELEEVKIVEGLLATVLSVVPELESSDDELMSPIRAEIKKEISEVSEVMDELEGVLGDLPDIDSSDESLSPVEATMSG